MKSSAEVGFRFVYQNAMSGLYLCEGEVTNKRKLGRQMIYDVVFDTPAGAYPASYTQTSFGRLMRAGMMKEVK